MIACYVSFGKNLETYLQAAFSALTFLNEPLVKKISVVTERPEFYEFLSDRIEVVPTDAREFEEWTGPEKYMFRSKTLGYKKAMDHNPGHDYICLDADTFRAGPITAAKASLARGRLGMHECFGYLVKASDGGNRRVFKSLRGKTIAGYSVGDATQRLNSGVTAIPRHLAEIAMDKILQAMDEIYSVTEGYWASEELAYNFAFAALGPVDDVSEGIGHYWGNKPQWTSAITDFFATHMMENSSLDDLTAAAAAFDFSGIPVAVHCPKRRRVLTRLLEKYLPFRKMRYYPEKAKEWE